MQIRVKLYGVFRIERFKEQDRDYPAGSRVQQVVTDLQLSPTLLGIILINGEHAEIGAELQNGDSLALLPLLGGG